MHSAKHVSIWIALATFTATAWSQHAAPSGPDVRLGMPVPLLGGTPVQRPTFKPLAPPRVVRAAASSEIEPRKFVLAMNESGLIHLAAASSPSEPASEKPMWLPEPTAPLSRVVSETIFLADGPGLPLLGRNSGMDNRLYASAEWLVWWTRGMQLPPLVTTASPFDPEATRGALGFGSTRLLYGDDSVLQQARSGARFTVGYQFDPCGMCSIEASYFFLGRIDENAGFTSDQFPVLARPFFNLNTGQQDRQLVASPGIAPGDFIRASGAIGVETSTSLMGAEVNLRRQLCCGCDGWNVKALAGYRYLRLSDHVTIGENIVALQDIPINPPGVPIFAGDRISVFDSFNSRNRFHGGQFGASVATQRDRWTFEGSAKLAIGATQQTVTIDGGQQIASANRQLNFVGGLYALPSNIGTHSQTRIGFVPEVGVKVGYNVTENIRVFVGYDFLYWTNVLRAGDQIDQALDVNLVPNSGGPFPLANQVRPRVPFQTTSYWAQGVSAGLLFRY